MVNMVLQEMVVGNTGWKILLLRWLQRLWRFCADLAEQWLRWALAQGAALVHSWAQGWIRDLPDLEPPAGAAIVCG